MPKPSRKTNNNAVSVEHLTVAYDSVAVLENITLSIIKGDVVAIIGPNGSGKTTLIKALLGLIKINSGDVRIFGKHPHAVRKKIGYVPQHFNFDKHFPITVNEFLQLALHRDAKTSLVTSTINEVGLPTNIARKQLGFLSGGQLQRVLIVQAILNQPDLLILDEPATGIDIVDEATFYDVIKHLNEKHQTTVILISHDVLMVSQKVDQVICINKKLLCSGPPKKTLTKSTLENLFNNSGVYEHTHHQHS